MHDINTIQDYLENNDSITQKEINSALRPEPFPGLTNKDSISDVGEKVFARRVMAVLLLLEKSSDVNYGAPGYTPLDVLYIKMGKPRCSSSGICCYPRAYKKLIKKIEKKGGKKSAYGCFCCRLFG